MGFESFKQEPGVRVENGPIKGAMSLSGLFLVGPDGKPLDFKGANATIPANTYNEANGVILIKKGHDNYEALPATDGNRELVSNLGLEANQAMSVPHLNEQSVWGAPDGEDFKRWKNLSERSS